MDPAIRSRVRALWQFAMATAAVLLSSSAQAQSEAGQGAATVSPSLDCAKTSTPVEAAICGDGTLARWDAEMGRIYHQALRAQNSSKALVDDQHRWVAARNQCAANPQTMKDCILEMTKKRTAGLAAIAASMQAGGSLAAAAPGPAAGFTNCDAIAAQASTAQPLPVPPANPLADLRGLLSNRPPLYRLPDGAYAQGSPDEIQAIWAQRVEQERLACRQRVQARAENDERAATQRRQYEQAVAERVRAEREGGYRRMSIEDFLLDGKRLAASGAKVSIGGFYVKQGKVERLFSPYTRSMWRSSSCNSIQELPSSLKMQTEVFASTF